MVQGVIFRMITCRRSGSASFASRRAYLRFSRLNRQRHRLLPRAVVVGLFTGFVAVGFHLCLDYGETIRSHLIEFSHKRGDSGMLVVAGYAVFSVVFAACLVKRFAPEAAGSGIPHLKAVLQGERMFRWLHVLVVKFLSGVIGISGGLALGREGPTVQMGGAVGAGVGKILRGNKLECNVLIAAGGGAGLSAAFNSPLSGITFVLEELQGRASSLEFFAGALACLVADMVCRFFLGQLPVFHVSFTTTPSLTLLPAFIAVGLASGLMGVAFNKALLAMQKLGAMPVPLRLAGWVICGLVLAITGWFVPHLLGGGQHLLDGVLDHGNELTVVSISVFFIIRFILTLLSYSAGTAGGIFSPVLVLGALLGVIVGNGLYLLFPKMPFESGVFAVVGMAAYFTAVVRAPLTGIVLMIEMTGNYSLILPLFCACFSSLMVADALHDLPIYEALMERELKK
jgi:CIC family chloride channel protein